MPRPLKGDQPLDQRMQLLLTSEDIAAVDDWMFANRVRTRSEAIRQLVARGFAEPVPADALVLQQHTEIGSPAETLEHLVDQLSALRSALEGTRDKIAAAGGKPSKDSTARLREATATVDETAEALGTLSNIVHSLTPEPPKKARRKAT